MSSRDIAKTFEDMYGLDVSTDIVTQATASVINRVERWSEVCPFLNRRVAQCGQEDPERLPYWQSAQHEVDFVSSDALLVEVDDNKNELETVLIGSIKRVL